MWIGRNIDGTVYGVFAQKQDESNPRLEEVPENHPDIITFRNRPRSVVIDPRDTKIAELEARIVVLERVRI